MAINELEVFAQMELDKGGVAYELENNGIVRLYKFQEWYWYKHNRYGNTPVYQVFRAKDGKGCLLLPILNPHIRHMNH